ncbi:homocysteine S-methyltransferase [Amycolatopsis sp. lyj-109]|uniref:homocysteine S-methyltransferase n=1 Tax=Amycolatopsis sp. lyj-109 TaxID=2789287 RepID=UPI00397B5767
MPIDGSLASALSRGPVVIDGGLSNQLAAAGHDLSDELWTARLLRDDPAAVADAHLAYFAAGASVVLTASYQASFAGFARHGIPAEETARLLRRSVSLARTARERYAGPDRPLWIAASVGPYGASLADGSEYRGRYGLSATQLRDFHRPRLEALAEAGPDLFAVETIPDVEEAEVLVRIAEELDIPVWLSYTVDGTSTRSGQPLRDAFALATGVPQVIATGINCSAPGDVPAAVALAADVTGKPVVVYPNSGEVWDAAGRRWTGRPSFAPEDVRGWADAGARLIGGCCRVGPAEIAELAAAVATPAT